MSTDQTATETPEVETPEVIRIQRDNLSRTLTAVMAERRQIQSDMDAAIRVIAHSSAADVVGPQVNLHIAAQRLASAYDKEYARAERLLAENDALSKRIERQYNSINELQRQLDAEKEVFPSDGVWLVSGDTKEQMQISALGALPDPMSYAALARHRNTIARALSAVSTGTKLTPSNVADIILQSIYTNMQEEEKHVEAPSMSAFDAEKTLVRIEDVKYHYDGDILMEICDRARVATHEVLRLRGCLDYGARALTEFAKRTRDSIER